MPEVRRIYRVNSADLGELNRLLADLGDRMDQLEGYRGKGRFLLPPTSDVSATQGAEVVRKSQLEDEVNTILADLGNYHPLGGGATIDLDADNLVTSAGLVVGGNAVIVGTAQIGSYAFVTEYGGLAVAFTAGEALSVGHVVYINQAGAARTAYKVPVDGDMPIGAVYAAAGVGATVWVVVSGVGYVMPAAAVTASLGYIATVTATAGQEGRVASAATVPAAPTHNREVGHFIEDGSGAGVAALCCLHFN